VVIEQETPAKIEAAMAVLDAIRDRRSVGRVRPERPPMAMIEAIIEAATWAPNHRLTEPWRFIVLAGEARHALGEVMAQSQAERRADDLTAAREAAARAAAKALRAPVIIAIAVEPAIGPKVVEIEEITAGAAATQNLLLAAHSLGLAAIWRTGDPTYDPAVKAFLALSPTASLLGFVYVGYPDAPPPSRSRRPIAEVTTWRGWDEAE
jgi:nitroreductase